MPTSLRTSPRPHIAPTPLNRPPSRRTSPLLITIRSTTPPSPPSPPPPPHRDLAPASPPTHATIARLPRRLPNWNSRQGKPRRWR
ncbi:hypothetical protein M758_10G012600 [Ceratodon purpureus]|uniref:Uncharacterized protein n=1 Tax=Ceratodon purpureus TaxID=3225 RepID=A0A8T0GGT1_CERPU|nr:hypothetical protein KC19_10G013500 [Ceratodon purpureus]KAG0602410.1 hypothetical protein M758_10G012600 [Ceratodon purpureus]